MILGEEMAAVADRSHADILSDAPLAPDPVSETMPLKFLLHLVGDLHQPLHAADDHDAGGTKELVTAEGLHPSNLHRYWDIEFVKRLGTDPRRVAASLIEQISKAQLREWSSGNRRIGPWKPSLSPGMTLTDCCRDPMIEVRIRCRWST